MFKTVGTRSFDAAAVLQNLEVYDYTSDSFYTLEGHPMPSTVHMLMIYQSCGEEQVDSSFSDAAILENPHCQLSLGNTFDIQESFA